jgi:hypothetical protein
MSTSHSDVLPHPARLCEPPPNDPAGLASGGLHARRRGPDHRDKPAARCHFAHDHLTQTTASSAGLSANLGMAAARTSSIRSAKMNFTSRRTVSGTSRKSFSFSLGRMT